MREISTSEAAIKGSPCFGYPCADQIFLHFLHKPSIFGHACSCSGHRFVKVLVLSCFPASFFLACDWPVHPPKQISPHVYTSKFRRYFPQGQNWQRKHFFHGTFTFHGYVSFYMFFHGGSGGHLWWELNPNELAPMDCLSSLKDSMLRSIRYSTSMGKHALYTILQVDSVGATRSDSWKFRTASWVWKMVF